MANALTGGVEVTCPDGTALTLVLDNNALCEIEDALDKPINAVFADAGKGRLSATRALLWGATRRHHPDMTLEECGDLLSEPGLAEALTKAADRSAEPEPKGAVRTPALPGKPPASTGRRGGGAGSRRG